MSGQLRKSCVSHTTLWHNLIYRFDNVFGIKTNTTDSYIFLFFLAYLCIRIHNLLFSVTLNQTSVTLLCFALHWQLINFVVISRMFTTLFLIHEHEQIDVLSASLCTSLIHFY